VNQRAQQISPEARKKAPGWETSVVRSVRRFTSNEAFLAFISIFNFQPLVAPTCSAGIGWRRESDEGGSTINFWLTATGPPATALPATAEMENYTFRILHSAFERPAALIGYRLFAIGYSARAAPLIRPILPIPLISASNFQPSPYGSAQTLEA